MLQAVSNLLVRHWFLPRLRSAESIVGYRPVFRRFPRRYINGHVSWDMTRQFRRAGLNIDAGTNYWTMGKVVSGVSARFDSGAAEYQSWLGAYAVRIAAPQSWTIEDYFKFAVVDQNNWLKMYGDTSPATVMERECRYVCPIRVSGYAGQVFELGCITHTDVGEGNSGIGLRLKAHVIASLFNTANRSLRVTPSVFMPTRHETARKRIRLRGYWAVINVEDNTRVILYANGASVWNDESRTDTFPRLRNDVLSAMRSCEIVRA
jgi:hypothetical protein